MRATRRWLLAAAIGVGFGGALGATAQAATLEIETDKGTYLPFEVITLTVVGTTTAEPSTPNVVVTIEHDDTQVLPLAHLGTDILSSGNGTSPWIFGGLQGQCNEGPGNFCRAFDQIAPGFPNPAAVDDSANPLANTDNDGNPATPGDGTWDAVFQYTVIALPGTTIHFDFNPAQWFGIGGPAPGSFVAGTTVTVVPEPSTAALLALGLGGLGWVSARGGRSGSR